MSTISINAPRELAPVDQRLRPGQGNDGSVDAGTRRDSKPQRPILGYAVLVAGLAGVSLIHPLIAAAAALVFLVVVLRSLVARSTARIERDYRIAQSRLEQNSGAANLKRVSLAPRSGTGA